MSIISCCISFDSYIKPQHFSLLTLRCFSCISFDSYIKPQLRFPGKNICTGCISFDSYIKPQRLGNYGRIFYVVYLLIPTSNHNLLHLVNDVLLVVYLLIPTSNHNIHV